MNILVTGGRSPYTLELIRLLGKSGHRVVSVEFISVYLSQFSKYVNCRYTITSPNADFDKFAAELLEVVKKEKIDLVIPTCEEVFHVAKVKLELEKYTKVFCEDIATLTRLHSKAIFIEDLKKMNLNIPETYLLSEYSGQLKNKKVVLKKDYSRFASNVHMVLESEVTALNLNSSEWVIQEFVPGKEASVYTQVVDGEVRAYTCYFKEFSIGGGATILFNHSDNPLVLEWVQSYFSKYPVKLTGQFSFDLMIHQDKVYPIECNPRPTSGVHLFSKQPELTKGFFESPKETLTPTISNQRVITLAMLLYGFKINRIKEWTKALFSSSDVIFSFRDLAPFFMQFPSFAYFAVVGLRRNIKSIEASTVDIEFNK